MVKHEAKDYHLHGELIRRCGEQDQEAQFEIYRLYYKAMYNTSLRITGDRAEAEDIMQESFLAAFSKIDTYPGDVSFGLWLKKIVVNKSIDLLRKRKIRFLELKEVAEKKTADEETDEDYENTKIQAERIRKAIALLPDGYRIVISLRLLEGYDHQEIAQILNISESNSRSQYIRAKQKVLKILTQITDEDEKN